MAISLNAVVGFNSTLQANYQHVPRTGVGASILKASHIASPLGLRIPLEDKQWGPCPLVANGDRTATETSDKDSANAERPFSDDQSPAPTLPPLDSPTRNSARSEMGPLPPEASNGSTVSSDLKEDTSSADIKSTPRRSRLTAREKLKAARVLNRYTESKTSKAVLGSKVLEVLRESDGEKETWPSRSTYKLV